MRLEITVMPRSGRFGIKSENGRIKVFLKSAPQGNKANLELLKEFRRLLKTEVRLVSGHSSRRKVIEVGLPGEELKKMLGI